MLLALLITAGCAGETTAAQSREASEDDTDNIEIIASQDRTVYEYRQNGNLVAIKVVPKTGRPYYMVPADGNGMPGDLEHARHLYPQWVILEW